MSVAAPTLDAFFDTALQVYEQAAAGGTVERDYQLAGRAFRVRYANPALAAVIGPALAHLAAPAQAAPFTVYAWGGELPGGQLPPPPWEALPYFERGNVRGYHGERYAVVFDRRPHTFSAVDHARQVGLYWARDASSLPHYERAAPLRRVLPNWRQPDGLYAVHAAAVGFPQGGVLLAGRGGSGKSTTAALCIGSALGFAGDDYILVEPGTPARLHALDSTAKLNRDALAWMPGLRPGVANLDRLDVEKALVYVAGLWPEHVAHSFPLRAILLPHPTKQPVTVTRPVAAEVAYKALLPDTLFTVLGPARLVTKALSALVRAVPCYELALGTEVAGVPAAIADLLRDYRERCVTLPPPTPWQALLLRAVTAPAVEAVAAWDEWRSAVSVDALEPESQWLLPLLYVQLRAAGVNATALQRYANVYRHNWYKNQLRLNALEPVLAALIAGGHAPVLVGGAALAAAYYPALGARPFDRVALHVPGLTAAEAQAAEAQFDAAVGAGLRWLTLPVAATHTVMVAGQALCVPVAAEALVQVGAGAGQEDHASALLWATDAVILSRQLDAAGWALAWQRAAELGVTAALRQRLDWLEAAGLPLAARVPA